MTGYQKSRQILGEYTGGTPDLALSVHQATFLTVMAEPNLQVQSLHTEEVRAEGHVPSGQRM